MGRDKVEIVAGTIASFISIAASETAQNYNVLYWETGSLAKNLTERGLPNFVRSGLIRTTLPKLRSVTRWIC